MNYTLVTDASYCNHSGIAVGAITFFSESNELITKVFKLQAKNSEHAELQALLKGIQMIPKEADVTAFTDVDSFAYFCKRIKDSVFIKHKLQKRYKSLQRGITKHKGNIEVLWAGEFGKDHYLLQVVHNKAINRMRQLRKQKGKGKD